MTESQLAEIEAKFNDLVKPMSVPAKEVLHFKVLSEVPWLIAALRETRAERDGYKALPTGYRQVVRYWDKAALGRKGTEEPKTMQDEFKSVTPKELSYLDGACIQIPEHVLQKFFNEAGLCEESFKAGWKAALDQSEGIENETN